MRLLISLLLMFCVCSIGKVVAQTIGGNAIYNFLKLPASAHSSSLGGVNVSHQSHDVSLIMQAPSLLRDSMSGDISASFNFMYGTVRHLSALTAFHSQKFKTTFAAGISYIDYGKVPETDAAGNLSGEFKPADYLLQVQASRKYENIWYYGVTLKYIHSSYGIYNSSGIAADYGVNFCNNATGFQAGLTAKNMGVQLKEYASNYEDLPFDIELGISQNLKTIPLQLSITAHHVHQFDIRYADSDFEQTTKGNTFNKVMQHFIFAAELYPVDKLELTASYNVLRARELCISGNGAGATGLSFGMGALYKKFQVRYGMSYYQSSKAYHQLSINLNLKENSF